MDKPRTCFSADGRHKRAFGSEAEAKQHKLKFLDIYECRACGWFHLAKKRGRR